MRTLTGIAVVVVVGALGALAAGVFGEHPDAGPGPPAPGTAPVLSATRVAEAPAPAKGASNPRVFYLETTTPVDDIPPGPGGYVVKRCPKGSRVINGYYFQTVGGAGTFNGFGLDDQGSSPFGFRKWAFYFDNVASAAGGEPIEIDGVKFGIVCDKDG